MHPLVAALKHHKTAVVLLALEIALTCAIVTNALFVIGDRLEGMAVSTGIADDELVWATTSALDLGTQSGGGGRANEAAADLAALARIPGVKSVAQTNGLPLTRGSLNFDVYLRPGDERSKLGHVAMYMGTPDVVKTLGLDIVQGRAFLQEEFSPFAFGGTQTPPAAIITQALAARLWPGKNPLGRFIYLDAAGSKKTQVVGVVGRLLNPQVADPKTSQFNVLLPVSEVPINSRYVLRVDAAARYRIANELPGVLHRIDPARLVVAHVYTQSIRDHFRDDRALVWLLAVVISCLLAITALGVVGVSSFWVQQRNHTIGVRRALGATRRNILRYFQMENFFVVSLGVAGGSLVAIGLNLWLIRHYELHRMPLAWLATGALVLWLLGQLAVLGPALRASNVPPMVATRST
jgi:putative ABC transport system permease protein